MATCPRCQAEIAAADVNVSQNIAFCRRCGEIHKLSGLTPGMGGAAGRRPVDFSRLPSGTWYRDEGDELVFGASTRSFIAIFLVPFATVWIGMVAVFTAIIVGGAFAGKVGPVALLPLLFMVPFWIGACFLFAQVAMSIAGRVEVRLRGTGGEVFTGVASIGRRRRFELTEFDRVAEGPAWTSGRAWSGRISLEGSRRLSFGALLNEERRYFLVSALRSVIEGRN